MTTHAREKRPPAASLAVDPRGAGWAVEADGTAIQRLLARPRLVLGFLVGLAAATRVLIAWQQPTPVFFPDEMIYSSLARGIAETGQPLYLGHAIHFPALLTSFLTAPIWLIHDTTVAYHLAQSLGALACSLAAIPVYLLARRLSFSSSASLLVAAGSLLLPDLVLSSLLMSEPYAYLLFCLALWAAHRALESVSKVRDQLLLLALLALLCFTRTQFVLLPLAYLFALVVQGVLDRSLRATLRAQLPLLVGFALPVLVVLAVGVTDSIGVYGSLVDFTLHLAPRPGALVHWLVNDLLVLSLSCGWLLAPGAVIGFGATLWRPRDRAERSFVLLCLPIFVGQLAEATSISVYATDAEGRYLIYLLPPLLIFFAIAARRGLLTRWPYAVGLLLLIPIALRAPIFDLNRISLNSSPILLTRFGLEHLIGIPDTYADIPFFLAGLAVVALIVWRAKAVPVLVGMIGCFLLAASVGGAYGEHLLATQNSSAASRPLLTGRGIDDALFLVGTTSARKDAMSAAFWNREITKVVALDRVHLTPLPVDRARVAPDGTLLVAGKPFSGELVVDADALRGTLRGAAANRIAPSLSLYRATEGPVQFRTLVTGLLESGLGHQGVLRAWPATAGGRLRGHVTLTLSVPRQKDGAEIVFRLPDRTARKVKVEPGTTKTITLPVASRGRWQATYDAGRGGYLVSAADLDNVLFTLAG